ncbi:MAG TPA: dihydrofolate reductase family protein [Candidatus Dormibacteraeota bacterium]|jgi:dihydrofolate reductase|nr:dihydrofolate reductase family protein [Candidatus Dormibacteraeota bacterium]
MGRLIYTTIASLDGYVEDVGGNFDWAAPDPEVFAFINDLERPIGTYLYGRGMYETMRFWETADQQPGQSAEEADFTRLWQAADKVVYSRTLDGVTTSRTRIERDFDPETVRRMKASSDRDLSVGGAALGASAFLADLVDELGLLVLPVLVGGGKRSLPDGVRLDLLLLDEMRFDGGVVYLRYEVRKAAA